MRTEYCIEYLVPSGTGRWVRYQTYKGAYIFFTDIMYARQVALDLLSFNYQGTLDVTDWQIVDTNGKIYSII